MSRRNLLSATHRLVLGPDFADSSRFHSAPFQRQPVNRSTGPRFHSAPLHRLKSSRTGFPWLGESGNFRKVPSAGRPRIRAFSKLPALTTPPGISLTSDNRASRWPYASPSPPSDGPRLTRLSEVRAARPRVPDHSQANQDFTRVRAASRFE